MSDNNTNFNYTGPTDGGKSKVPASGAWWKILIAILCGALIVSPIDIMSGLPFDDLGYIVGMVTSIVSAIKGFKFGRASADDDNINNVDSN